MFAGFNKSGLEKEEKAICRVHAHTHLWSRLISLQVFPLKESRLILPSA